MGYYLNIDNAKLKRYMKSRIFVDKSLLIKECNRLLGSEDAYMCVTRPRRFGKTLALSMLNAYYSKGCDSRELFKGLKIYDDPSFETHLNRHNVIWVDMAEVYTYLDDKNDFLEKLNAEVVHELAKNYGDLDFSGLKLGEAIRLINSEKGETFIFLIDEWDVIYREQENNHNLCDSYTEFLRSLFKSSRSSSCFDLVYMTGILPIRRYSTQSTLNMFTEYNMLDSDRLAPLYGFTEAEVKGLCEKTGMDFGEIKSWYDGYRLGGMEIYNPKSVVTALEKHRCGNYWTATSAIEAVTDYMSYDHGALKGEIASMIAGGKAPLDPEKFSSDLTKIDSKDAALAVLVHLGYLGYLPPERPGGIGTCYIPNDEIRTEFERALEKVGWSDIYDPISNSERLLKDTLAGNCGAIDEAFDRNHKELASPFSKNDENVLSVIAAVSYYKARVHYSVRKEEVSMNGRSDISFFPKEPGYPPFIVELKAGRSPEEAIEQIKSRRYWEAWDGYKGKILLVGINYDEKTLKHSSKTEWIEA
jgi:hypothetical protein